jgi:hypothetical protein
LRVTKLGTIPNSDVAEIALWKDMGFKDGVFSVSDDGDGVSVGVPVATGTFQNVGGFDIVDLSFTSNAQTLTSVFQQYFVTVRLSTTATEGTTLGLEITDSSAFTIPAIESTARIAENNFPMTTYLSDVIKTPAPIMLKADNIAAFYSNVQNATVPQGNTGAGFLRLAFWAREFQGILDKIKVTRIGTASDLDVSNVRLYVDGLNGTDGDGSFQAGSDTLINSSVVAFSTSAATLDISPNILIDGTTKYLFVVMSLEDSASIGSSIGVRIPSRTDVQLADGLMVDFLQDPTTQSFPVLSGTPLISATNDRLQITPVPVAPAAATQGDLDVPVVRLDMKASDHTVIWQGLRINRKNANQVNQPTDVDNIKIYYDTDGSLTLDTSIDQLITPTVEPAIFRTTTLSGAISGAATNIPVISVAKFPTAPGRLLLEDNTGNREVVSYTGVDAVFNEFTGVTRGLEGTTAVAHSLGATVEAQGDLQILGPFGGQEITKNLTFRPETTLAADIGTSSGPITITVASAIEFPQTGTLQIGSEIGMTYTGKTATTFTGVSRPSPVAHISGETIQGSGRNKSYFVTYDVAALAVPGRLAGQQTVLGLEISSSSYVTVGAPDIIDPVPSFNAEIGDILEFGDTVTVISTEGATGPTLQQGAVNQPVMMLTLNTAKAEAYWSGLRLNSTGTATPSDVALIKLWHDADNNGIFTTGGDVLVSSGTYGNTGNPTIVSLAFSATAKLLVTPTRSITDNISSRYFVTYDMQTLATPEKTLAVSISGPSDFTMISTPFHPARAAQ